MVGGDGEPERTDKEISDAITKSLISLGLFSEDMIVGASPETVVERVERLPDDNFRGLGGATLREKLEAIAAKIGIPVDAPPAQPTRRRYDSFTGELPAPGPVPGTTSEEDEGDGYHTAEEDFGPDGQATQPDAD
tara:strand:- start:479 stop:883 length:405 start_codon:yes stop_codon:yes gene_type:complete